MVKVNFNNTEYDVSNPIILGSVSLDITQAEIFPNGMPHKEGELARLYLDTLPLPLRSRVSDITGEIINLPAKTGVDLATATALQIINYMKDATKKSDSVRSLCLRVLLLRFKPQLIANQDKIPLRFLKELQLLLAEIRNDKDFLGEVGFHGKVFLDKEI